MKKTAFILIMFLLMASALTAGTLAMYTTTIDDLAQGGVVAKDFVFVGEGTDSFAQGVKIAPAETVEWQFNVKNYSSQYITETDLYYKLTFDVHASEGKSAIAPLTVTVKDEGGNIVGSASGVGTFDVMGEFPLSQTGQGQTYTVSVYWPSDDSIDIDYAGNAFGTTVNIDAIASQAPLGASDPGTPPPQTSNVSVLYQTTESWQNGQSGNYRFGYSITITNHSDQPIEDWTIDFTLTTDRLTNTWSNAKMIHSLPDGVYRFVSPNYNNPSMDNILPGQSVTFGGQGVGFGTDAPQNVKVGGSNTEPADASLTYDFGSLD